METVQDHLTCDGFDAWIVEDGAKAPLYAIEHKEGERKASCWISSEADKEFSVSFCRKQKDEYDYCLAMIKLDGHVVAYSIFTHIDRQSNPITITVSSVRTSFMEVRKFAFASLELTDDDLHLEDPSTQNIGEISITIQRIKNLALSAYGGPRIYPVPTDASKVHERSKKGLAHQIKFSSVTEKPPVTLRENLYKAQGHGESITFVFKYRPIAMLQATGIVPHIPPPLEKESPRSSSPVKEGTSKRSIPAVKTEIEDGDASEEEDEDDLARERELLAELERVRNRKRAKKEANAHSKKKIKTEAKTYFTPGEVIDLT
ncbi:hypothetical protein BJ912DRAFT_979854 [Pholiota molesta]|nr:hypothetical protein BJ912DRAFT_979854 [Pholiota molesta]